MSSPKFEATDQFSPEPLERRILFDAAGCLACGLDPGFDALITPDNLDLPVEASGTVSEAQNDPPKQLLVIDSGVNDHQQIISDFINQNSGGGCRKTDA